MLDQIPVADLPQSAADAANRGIDATGVIKLEADDIQLVSDEWYDDCDVFCVASTYEQLSTIRGPENVAAHHLETPTVYMPPLARIPQ
jgi:hypothetical protein